MIKSISLVASFFLFSVSNAQTGIVKDPDGFCNIRASADDGAKIIDTLHSDRLVHIFADQEKLEWYQIEYLRKERNNMDKVCGGFIHRSRVVLFTSLGRFSRKELSNTQLLLKLDSLTITIATRSFSQKGRKLQFGQNAGEEKFLRSIDSKFPWGTDGNRPREQYRSIELTLGKVETKLEPSALNDLFEPNLGMTSAYYDRLTERYYLEAVNGDGAGAYMVVWVFKAGKMISRETYIPF